ncbi:MAG: type II toxin-antitoxin system VapC family toxin [Desulfobacterales bacterium]|nr:type II toxin-antitoxin system VapC family toxin [Desulfobacterales bacterium]
MLLDTYIFLWWLFDDSRLSKRIRQLIRNIDNTVYISAASVWEISTKYRLGKLPEAASVARNVPLWIERAGFGSLSVTPEHAQLAGSWDIAHRDPFDRMLAAQAKSEKLPLVSIDRAFIHFPIDVIKS